MPDLVIRFIDAPDLVSKGIEWQTNSIWCHAEGLSRDGKSWVGAHAISGIEARPLDWCRVRFERRYSISVTDVQYEKAMAYMESKLGTPYDYADIIGLLLHNRHVNQSRRMDCSAFMLGWMWAGEQYALNVMPGFSYLVTPEMLHLSPIFIGRCIYSTASVPM